MSQLYTIKASFLEDSIKGTRKIESKCSVIQLYVIPRVSCSSITKSQTDLGYPSFYILTGVVDGKKHAYIGQTSSFKQRSKDHNRKKKFWDTAYVFVAPNKIDKTDIEYLEYVGLQEAKKVGLYNLSPNKQKPDKPKIADEAEENELKSLFEDVKSLTYFAGCDIFYQKEDSFTNTYYIESKGIKALGYYDLDNKQFVVQKGSEIVPNAVSSYNGKLSRNKKIKESTASINGKTTLNKDIFFDSPSGASNFVLGRPSNGWIEWKDKNGKSLDENSR